ncbi:sugar phosphate isomerase/epimerase family protein [Cecembia lonarensis]|uniref:Xylose isomerase-like TIM barrel n=1 Tax=Cecembia lonarensis (strain CCUG 58316 / KCTC 22772 / LW9) TaxID=1225176 RepID=K1KUI6_CECL9|nr:sugar phosphate isomerase/epimerase family protein [Cecembia lonarensis]EKB47800.1 Xylose isomerase-like TIM barrel [Cecembia lonarensis LW9]
MKNPASSQRRDFLKKASLASMAFGLLSNPFDLLARGAANPPFKISLAEWSVNRLIFSGKLDHLDFPLESKKHGILAVEYVNQFFMDKAQDKAYLGEMNTRCQNEGIEQVLIMCDREGMLGAKSESDRLQTVENHKKWVEAAQFLGCHSIRINAYTEIPWSADPQVAAEAMKLCADGMRPLCEFADNYGIDVLIENHGGYSSDGKWLSDMLKMVDHPRAGSLPDFGNFVIQSRDGNVISYDSYRGVDELMPLAKGVSLKPYVYDDAGNQSPLDYERMLRLVLFHGYHGHVGIEHGDREREWESIVEIREILEDFQKQLG